MWTKAENRRGNILFIVLIAVVLFAALTYAVTKASRGGNSNASTEKNDLVASEVLDYAASLRGALMRMKTVNGCTNDQLNFYTPAHWYNYTNPNAPASKKCNVFDPAGGGQAYISPEKLLKVASTVSSSSTVEHFIANTDIPQIGTNCATASCADLYMTITIMDNVAGSLQFCQAINRKLKLASFTTVPNITNGIWGWPPFVGTYTNANTTVDPRLNGLDGACFHDLGNANYMYYQVLVAR